MIEETSNNKREKFSLLTFFVTIIYKEIIFVSLKAKYNTQNAMDGFSNIGIRNFNGHQ